VLFKLVPDGYETLPKFVSGLHGFEFGIDTLLHNKPEGIVDIE